MTPVVQAVCPQCKKTLRVPADWLDNVMRCKFCGLAIHFKLKAGAVLPGHSNRPQPARTAPTAAPLTNGIQRPANAAYPASPPAPPAQQAGRGAWRKGLVVGLCVCCIAAISTVLFWSQLS